MRIVSTRLNMLGKGLPRGHAFDFFAVCRLPCFFVLENRIVRRERMSGRDRATAAFMRDAVSTWESSPLGSIFTVKVCTGAMLLSFYCVQAALFFLSSKIGSFKGSA